MGLYKFTGTQPETFPTILTADGSLVAEPGQVIDLDGVVDHARLELVKRGKATTNPIAGRLVIAAQFYPSADVDAIGVDDVKE